jgi:polar amino acid transport system substrate-binding protein
MSRFPFVAISVAVLMSSLSASAQSFEADSDVAELARQSAIRIGVFPSFQYARDSASGQPRGLAIGIAQALAARLGIANVVTVEHPTPPQVIACVKGGGCDFGFMLIDPARATEIDFSPPFVRSDFTYLLPAGSPIRSAAEVDHPGVRVAVVRGHASTLAWQRLAKQAIPVFVDSYESAVEIMRSGNADAFASIREMLLQYSSQLPGSRVLADSYQTNLAGVAVAKGKPARLAFVRETLDDMKRSGALQQIIREAGLRDVEIVPLKDQ